jgi:hypothetical protein
LESHIKYTDPTVPRKKGIGGAHNKEQLLTNDIEIVKSTPHPTLEGVETIEYQMPKLDKTGTLIPGEYQSGIPKVKTVYDPNIISDEVYMEKGVQAANDALSKSPDGLLPREWVGNDGAGVKWRGYSDGNGNITSFFPEQ